MTGMASLIPKVRPWVMEALARYRILALVTLHSLAFAAIYLLAHVIRFDGNVPSIFWKAALGALPLVVSLKVLTFLALRCHRGWWRSATFADLTGLAEAATLGSLALAFVNFLPYGGLQVPRSVLLIDWTSTLIVLCGARVSIRLLRDHYVPLFQAKQLSRVLIIGAGDAGEALVRQLGIRPQLGLKVVGLLDPDPATHGRTLAGVRVLGKPSDLAKIATRQRAEVLLIPVPAVPPAEVRALSLACNAVGLKAQVVPGFDELLSGTLTVRPRDIDIQDLLCRAPVRLDSEAIGSFLEGRVVLVTGASGSIGSELCRQILAFRPDRLILLDHSENGLFYLERELRALVPEGTTITPRVASITDSVRIRTLFSEDKPQVVFHAAAHKHVPLMEANPGEAVKNNVFGTRTVVDEAFRVGVEAFVMVSTDKAVNPTSVMGVCKRLAETYVQSLSGLTHSRLVTVRFGNVLGSVGSVVPIFKEQIRQGGPLTVTHPEMTRFFMTIPEAAQLVLQAGAQGQGGEIFVLDMGEPVKVLDLARDMIRLSGQTEGRDIRITFTGLRPGEKLFEELYDETEELLPTSHPKIHVAQHSPYPAERLYEGLKRLAQATDGSPDQVITLLKELVPDYRPDPTIAKPATASKHSANGSNGHALQPSTLDNGPLSESASPTSLSTQPR